MDMENSLSYDIDLSGEPSGISAYMVLPADTTQESQNLGLMVERLCSECAIAARVRQYYGGNREDFYDLLDWTSLSVSVDNELTISVDKPAVQAGGKTILELKMTSSNSLPFVSGAKVVLTNPWTIQTLLVPQNHVATICDGGDDYRFGFNGQEKDNEVKGMGNSVNFKYRMEDTRLGRFFSVDPLASKFPWNSPYAFAENDVIRSKELEGLEAYRLSVSSGENNTKSYNLQWDEKAKPLENNQVYLNDDGGKNDEVVSTDQVNSRYGSLPYLNPTTAPSSVLGTMGYYKWRTADFNLRTDLANVNQSAPEYYMGYGDKYINRFTNELAPTLSSQGKQWVADARLGLQTEMENGLKTSPKLELNNAKHLAFAFDTHVPAYTNAGVLKLPVSDLIKIGFTPDRKDFFSINGQKQFWIMGGKYIGLQLYEIGKFRESMDTNDELPSGDD